MDRQANMLKVLTDIKYALDNSAIVAITDVNGVITYVNDKFCKVSNYSQEELIGVTHRLINSGFHPKSFWKNLWETVSSGRKWEGEVQNKKKNGEPYWVDTTIIPLLDHNGKPYQFVAIRYDITEKKKIEWELRESKERYKKLALHDVLTGLPNRRSFIETLNQMIVTHPQLAILFLDLDRFKLVNDTYGHAFGDELLKKFVTRLQICVGDSGVCISRQSGDEFIFISPYHNIKKIEKQADIIQQSLAKPFFINGKEIFITASIGISLYPEHSTEIGELIRKADIAMYKAKNNGGNKYVIFQDEQEENVKEKLIIETALRRAVEQEEFRLYYQPKFNASTGAVNGMEALIRWYHPELGIISPDRFIPVAEQTGLINEIGEWVLRTACRKTMLLINQGYHLSVSVNVSIIQLIQRSFVNTVRQILTETGLPSQFLELEITETVAIQHKELVNQVIHSLKGMGVKIAIDDFGTGYSSMIYLKEIPVDTVKIDRSFVNEMNRNLFDLKVIEAIISVSQSLNLSVIAEGVETHEQLELLKSKNCDSIQGFIFSKPLPELELEQFLQKSLIAR
ncbi:EAL domain-containing protein [Bacillus sp. DNRA2]|uniref:sensor domain-containing protein n=1 Tax=Bacillus sp. DNRA2 TaxID=2723053 RepID=UPI00145E81F2|nr:EAL domain-containing protein [Bacillus sp. DNRA2]NMD72819.1 EAL domain-containing protein [Bacillus sp. DNRA2]